MNYFIWVVPSIITSLICLTLSLLIWKRRNLPGAKLLLLTLAAIFIWATPQSLIEFLDGDYWNVILSKIQYFGVVSTPVIWLLFTFSLLGKKEFVNKKNIMMLFIVPIITLILVWTNEFHHLIWENIEYKKSTSSFMNIKHGLWFKVHTLYSYTVIAISTIYAAIYYYQNSFQRTEAKTIIFVPILAFVMNVVYLQEWIDFNGVDLTPMGFSFGLLILTWILYKENLMQLVPIARSVLFEKMDDAVVVISHEHRVLDVNLSAVNLFNVDKIKVVGKPFLDMVLDEKIIKEIVNGGCSEIEINKMHFQALRTILSLDNASSKGYLVVFRNISELKETQNSLVAAREQLNEANKVLEDCANTDVLTGLPNRRYFFDRFTIELERSRRYGTNLYLLILDLDHFKKINDTFGHPSGDSVLKRVAGIMLETIREIDLCARIGGEEFAFILTETNVAGAKLFAERIRMLIKDSHKGNEIAITTSIGLTENGKNDTTESLFEKADKALYISKNTGRNKISVLENEK